MLKKYLLIFTFLLIIFSLNKSFAFLDKTQSSTFLTNITYDNLHVVSTGDFDDKIDIQIQDAAPNTSYDIYVKYDNGDYDYNNPLTTVTTNSNGTTTFSTTKNWTPWTPNSNSHKDYKAFFKARPDGNSDPTAFTAESTYTAKVYYTNTGISNTAGITNNGTVAKGTAVTFTCSSSSEMYYGAEATWPSSAVKVQSKYDSPTNNINDYTLTYSPTLNTAGKYHVECSNIGYNMTPSTITDFVFTVVDNFDITSISSSPNYTSKANTISWTSTASTCNVYDSSKTTKLATGVKSGNSWTGVVATSSIRTTAGNQTFEIKCYDAIQYPDLNSLTADSDEHTGWKSYTAVITDPPVRSGDISVNPTTCTIPVGSNTCSGTITVNWTSSNTTGVVTAKDGAGVTIGTGATGSDTGNTVTYSKKTFTLSDDIGQLDSASVTTSCATGSSWDSGSNQCVYNPCPTGQLRDSGGVCRDTFNISSVNSNPNKVSTDNTFTWVSQADVCNIYDNTKTTRLNPTSPTRSGNNWTGVIPDYNMGSTPGARVYYIKCASTINPKRLPDTSLEADPSDEFTGFRAYNVTIASNGTRSGDISANPSSCTIPVGSNTCTSSITVNWTSSNTTGVVTVKDGANVTIGTGATGSDTGNTVTYTNKTFTLSDNNGQLDTASVTTNCASGSSWDATSGTCKATYNCPAGYPPYPNATNPTVCGPLTADCDFVLPGQNDVSCTPHFVCLNSTAGNLIYPTMKTLNKSGANPTVVSPFPWIKDDIQYEFYCPDEVSPKLIKPALTKSYTHFQAFNLSTNSVRKGTGINLNWIVENPNDSCKIVGTAIKTNVKVFDTKDGINGEGALDEYIATSTLGYSSTRKNIASGEYKNIMNSYWTVNQSTKFIASCSDSGTYKPGNYQIIKEVYVIGENE